jgi:hypothetical protein
MHRRNEHLDIGFALVPRRLEQPGMVLSGEVSPEERNRRQRNRSFDQQVHHDRKTCRRASHRDPRVRGMFRQVQDLRAVTEH